MDILPVDAAGLCPHCGAANRCAIATGASAADCWCMSTPLNADLVKRYQGVARCLCRHCGATGESPKAPPP